MHSFKMVTEIKSLVREMIDRARDDDTTSYFDFDHEIYELQWCFDHYESEFTEDQHEMCERFINQIYMSDNYKLIYCLPELMEFYDIL